MRLSLCTISFRHQLISIDELAEFARANDFQGIELWAAHARNLAPRLERNGQWLSQFGLHVPMLSDYLPLEGDLADLRLATISICSLARRWGARKIRTFAGSKGSSEISQEQRQFITSRLREIALLVGEAGCSLLVETHPDTLADTLASTSRLIEEVGCPALKINFDVLHVWEGGDDPVAAHQVLAPHIAHYHLKNIRSRDDLRVFAPGNIYAAAGSRDGMVPLFEGGFDYQPVLREIAANTRAEASLEWFGNDCGKVLAGDRKALRQMVETMSSSAHRDVGTSKAA